MGDDRRTTEDERRRAYAQLKTGVLLEQLTTESAAFEPAALALMEAELAGRGISRSDIAAYRRGLDLPSPAGGRISAAPLPDDLVPVGCFADHLAAEQARLILDQAGIAAVVRGEDALFPHVSQSPYKGAGLTLLVLESQADEARSILEEVPPPEDRGEPVP